MNSEKTTLPSLRNIEWRTVKVEANKLNQVLTYISTIDITELNELIYAGAKLVSEKIAIPSKSTKEESKPGWEFRLETQIKNQRKQTKMMKERKDTGICRNKKEKATQEKITIQLKKINRKVLAKEGRLKRYRQRVKQYRQNRTFQKQRKKILSTTGRTKTFQQPDAKETERFGTKIWQPKNNEEAEWKNNMTRELEGFEEGPKAEIHIDFLKTTLKNIKLENAWP